MTALSDLIVAKTRAEILAALIGELQAGSFPTTDWTEGGPERTLIEAEAATEEDLWAAASAIASGAHVDLATNGWLTLLAAQRYQIDRTAAVATVGTVELTCAVGSGPYTIGVGQLRFQSVAGNTYRNTTGGVLTSAAPINVTVTAEAAGADEGGDGAGTITTLLTPLAGVTCTNPASTFSTVTLTGGSTGTVTPTFGTPSTRSWVVLITVTGQTGAAQFKLSNDGGLSYSANIVTGGALVNVNGTGINLAFANGAINPSFNAGDSYTFTSQGTWYTTQGADEESDASLRQRCKARWPGLSSTPTDDVYTAMAKAASASVTKVAVEVDGVVPAQVNITIAGASGPVGGTVETAVQDYVDARRPLTDVPVVASATAFPVTLAGATVRVRTRNLATAQARAQANVQAYLAGVAIGKSTTVKVRYSQVIEAILRESGDEDDSVSGLTVNGGAVDVTVTAGTVCTWAQTIATALTWSTY